MGRFGQRGHIVNQPNFNTICREMLVVHKEVHRLIFAAMMPGLRPAEIKRLKRQEGDVRRYRRQLCAAIKQECSLRVACWEENRPYSNWPRARQGTRGR
jgi:hypothetical protein